MTETFRPFDYQVPMVEHLLANDRAALGLLVLLHLARDVGGKYGLQPLSGAAADDPSVSCGYRASKASGKSGGTQGKAFVPGHGEIIPRKIKCAMRKINLAKGYALRILCACPTPTKSPLEIGDSEFIAARKAFDAATALFDAAWDAESEREEVEVEDAVTETQLALF